MKNLEDIGRKLMNGQNADLLTKAAASPEAARLASLLDRTEVEQAAKSGDTEALSRLLRQVMSTPDGKALAKMLGGKGG